MTSKWVVVAVALAFASSPVAAKSTRQAQSRGEPYTLVISRPQAMTQMNYSSAQACEIAKQAILSQFDSRPRAVPGGGVIIPMGPPEVFCVPR